MSIGLIDNSGVVDNTVKLILNRNRIEQFEITQLNSSEKFNNYRGSYWFLYIKSSEQGVCYKFG